MLIIKLVQQHNEFYQCSLIDMIFHDNIENIKNEM